MNEDKAKTAAIEKLMSRAGDFENKLRLAVWLIAEAGLGVPEWLLIAADAAEPEPELRNEQCSDCPFPRLDRSFVFVKRPEKWGCHQGGLCKGMADVSGRKRGR